MLFLKRCIYNFNCCCIVYTVCTQLNVIKLGTCIIPRFSCKFFFFFPLHFPFFFFSFLSLSLFFSSNCKHKSKKYSFKFFILLILKNKYASHCLFKYILITIKENKGKVFPTFFNVSSMYKFPWRITDNQRWIQSLMEVLKKMFPLSHRLFPWVHKMVWCYKAVKKLHCF